MQRRRHPRFLLRQTWNGEFRIFHDVVVQSWSPTSVWVTAVAPFRSNELFGLDVGAGPDRAFEVHASACMPFIEEGEMRHRVRFDPVTVLDGATGAVNLGRRALVWQVMPVTLVDISRTGCRIETRAPLGTGATGRLRISAGAHEFGDHSRVAWCRAVEGGGSAFRAGVELFPSVRVVASGDRSLADALNVVADTQP